MTGFAIAAFILTITIGPWLVISLRRTLDERRALRAAEERAQCELASRREADALAEVTSWEPPDLEAMAEAARKAAKELAAEPEPGTNVRPIPFSASVRPDLYLALEGQLSEDEMVEFRRALTFESGTRLAERAREMRQTTARSVSVDGTAENSIIVTGDGNKVGMRWSDSATIRCDWCGSVHSPYNVAADGLCFLCHGRPESGRPRRRVR